METVSESRTVYGAGTLGWKPGESMKEPPMAK